VARIRVTVAIDASPRRIWGALRDISTHTRWMEDAVAIRFVTKRRRGVGTAFECDTKVGPFRLVDRMEVTEWRPRRSMGVRHVGLVRGEGRFTITPRRARRGAEFRWEEHLALPRWMGGRLGGVVISVVLRQIWRRNLRNLKHLVEHPT